MEGIWSSPGYLDSNNDLSNFLISATLMIISSRHLTFLRGVKAGAIDVLLVDMLEKQSFNSLALSSSS